MAPRLPSLLLPLVLAASGVGLCSPIFAQGVVQPLTPDADALAAQIRLLAVNPLDVNALVHAGELALKLDDATAATAFFARAERIDPRNPQVKAGQGSILVQSERPGAALRRFAEAEVMGLDAQRFAADRGLAYDLIGEQDRAQRDYRLALRGGADDETVRRYALSFGISGKRDLALAQLDKLLRKSDRGAWRARAFVLAMTGDGAGAARIATSMMPAGLAQGLQPYFERLPALGPIDRAFAVHFGELRPTPQRAFDARLVPSLPVLGPDPSAPVVAVAAVRTALPRDTHVDDRRDRNKKKPRDRIETATAAPPTPLPQPPSYVARAEPMPEPILRSLVSTAPVRRGKYSDAVARANLASRAAAPQGVARAVAPSQPAAAHAPVLASAASGVAAKPPPFALPAMVTATSTAVAPAKNDIVKAQVAVLDHARIAAPRAASVVAPPARTSAVATPSPVARPPIARTLAVLTTPPPPISFPPAATRTASTIFAPVKNEADRREVAVLDAAKPAALPSTPTTSPSARGSPPAAFPPAAITQPALPVRVVEGAPALASGAITLPVTPPPTTTSRTEDTPAPAATLATPSSNVAARAINAVPVAETIMPPPAQTPAGRSEDSILASIISGITVPTTERDGAPVEAPPSPIIAPPRPAVKVAPAAAPAEAKTSVAEVRSAKSAKANGKKDVTKLSDAAAAAAIEGSAKISSAQADKKLAAAEKASESKKIADARKADAKKAADAKKLADEKAARKKDPKVLEPTRIWVQVAGGAEESDLPKAWSKVREKAPAVFKGKQGWKTPLRATNRVLAGPFKSDAEARAFVNTLAKSGLSGFSFTSEPGQKIEKLPAK